MALERVPEIVLSVYVMTLGSATTALVLLWTPVMWFLLGSPRTGKPPAIKICVRAGRWCSGVTALGLLVMLSTLVIESV